jgi:protein O-mannosyl-transferase
MGAKTSKPPKAAKASPGRVSATASTDSTPSASSRLWVSVSVLVVAALLAYSNCFTSPFVLDDADAIVTNASIRSLTPISRALSGPFQSSTAGRPLVNLSFALNYAAGELSPVGYHAVNLAIHILCGLVLFGIVRRTLAARSTASTSSSLSNSSNLLALFSALLWLLHPLETEAVDYVTQRTESMMALAYLVTLYGFIRGTAAKNPWRWYSVSIASCWLGMLCKESMATAPVMVLLYDVVFCSGSVSKALRQRAALYGGLAASWIALAVLLTGNGRSHSAGFASGVSVSTYLLNQAPIVLRYLRLVLWPAGLVFDYGLPKAIAWSDALPAAAAVLAIAAATVAAWFFDRRLAYLATWVFVTLAPTSTIVPIATEVGAERRMYLPMMAIATLIVLGARAVLKQRAGFVGSLAAVSVALGALTFVRNADYQDTDGLWRQVIARYPHGRAHYNLGVSLREAGRRAEAIREYELAADDMPDAEYALGFEALSNGNYDEAIVRLRRYLQLKPLDINAIRASNLLGRSLLLAGRPDEAATAFRDTLRMHADDADATGALGQALLNGGHLDEALSVLSAFVQRAPQLAPAHFNLGLTFLRLRRFDEAASELSQAVNLNPNDPASHANLGTTLVELGRTDEAANQFRQAFALESDPGARAELQSIIRQLEDEKKGAGHR